MAEMHPSWATVLSVVAQAPFELESQTDRSARPMMTRWLKRAAKHERIVLPYAQARRNPVWSIDCIATHGPVIDAFVVKVMAELNRQSIHI